MRTKKLFSFDEEKDAEEVIVNGFPNGVIDYGKMYVVAKYFRQHFNYGEIRLEREIIKFCKAQDPNFNPITEVESIKKWIVSAMGYNLRKIDSVIISPKEIAFVKEIDSEKDRKILFAILILTKALKTGNTRRKKDEYKTSPNYYIHFSNFTDVIHICQLKNLTEVDLADILFKYKEHFTFYNPEKQLIKVNYVDNNIKEGITIDKLDKAMDYYELLFDKKQPHFYCVDCGKEIVKNSNKQKRCKECSAIERNRKQKELMRNRRNVSI